MKIAARRRLAVGVVATTSAMLAGVLIAPASTAAPNGLAVDPSGVVNTNAAAVLTFNTTEADLRFGGEAIFTRVGTSSTFDVDIPGPAAPGPNADRSEFGTKDFTDLDGGGTAGTNVVGQDGPADAGTYNVTVNGNDDDSGLLVEGGSDSCVSCFTVLSPGAVAVSSVAPNSLRPGNGGNVSVLGNNFERSSRIDVLLADGSVDSTIVTNQPPQNTNGTNMTDNITTRTELKRRFVVGAGAAAGARDIRVTNLDGSSATCSACFFVAGAALTSSSPTAAFNDPGQELTRITFNGPTVADGTPRLEYVGDPQANSRSQLSIVGEKVEYTGTSVTGLFDLSNAAPGSNAYQPFVQGENGIVNACDTCRFTVIQRDTRTPTLTSLDRESDPGVQKNLRIGETATFVATGTNFSEGATLVFSPATGLTVTGVEFVSTEQLLVTISASNEATAGDKNVTARLTDGKTSPSCNACLTVTPATSTASPNPTGTASPTASASASPTASSTASPGTGSRADARYAGLASPQRVLDTRANRGARRSGEIVLDLSQRISDPNATAAVLNVTVTNATARGFLVAYPNGNPKPGTSNVNFEASQTQANEVVVALPANRRVSLFVDSASAHVIADLVGFFTTTSATDTGRVTTNAPVRALDTRSTEQKKRRGEVVLDLSDRLPQGSTDAILNVTVTTPSARGFVTVFPTGTTRPGTSNVNFEANQTQANEVITGVGTGSNAGKVSLFVDSAEAALIVDVVGAVTPGNASGTQVFTALNQPTRALDTRSNSGARRSGNVEVTMPSTVPSNATGVILNVTATNGSRPGFVTVFPTGSTNPGTSNVNFPTNRTQANEVTTALGTERRVTLFVGGANTPAAHLIVDVVGYLTGQGAPAASGAPSASPSCTPSQLPIGGSSCPSASPTASPTASATASPTASTTASPTASTTASPTASTTASPSASTTASPTATASPTP